MIIERKVLWIKAINWIKSGSRERPPLLSISFPRTRRKFRCGDCGIIIGRDNSSRHTGLAAVAVRRQGAKRVTHRWARPGLTSCRSGEEDTFSPHFFLAPLLRRSSTGVFLYFYPSRLFAVPRFLSRFLLSCFSSFVYSASQTRVVPEDCYALADAECLNGFRGWLSRVF